MKFQMPAFVKSNKNTMFSCICVVLLFLVALVLLYKYNESKKNIAFVQGSTMSSELSTLPPNAPQHTTTTLNTDLLPKTSSNDSIQNTWADIKSLAGIPSVADSRNANLQLRADPCVTFVDTGPFNQSTITKDTQSPGLNISSVSNIC